MSIKFNGDWESLLPLMKEAARNNKFLQITVPVEEYKRLKNGGLESMKKGLQNKNNDLKIRLALMGGNPPSLVVQRL